MISNAELKALIAKAEAAGATVSVDYDRDAFINEGREIVEFVTVQGLKGCGLYPMSALSAGERLRQALAA